MKHEQPVTKQSDIQAEVLRRKKIQDGMPKQPMRDERQETFEKSTPDNDVLTIHSEIPKKDTMVKEPFSRSVSMQRSAPPASTVSPIEPPIIVRTTPETRSTDLLPKITTPAYSYEYDEPKKSSKKTLYFALLVLLLAVGFGVSAFFKSAEIRIAPRQESHALGTTFTAKKDGSGMSLGFQVVTISKDIEKKVEATGEQRVEKKAQGTVVLYNNFSAQSQKLVATTRLQTPEGLIFRLVQAVTIPGKQGATPGQVTATVVADAVGSTYNVGLKDFTIPGFKGTTKSALIYARSKTSMTGGFSGMQKIVATEVLATSDTQMTASLKASLTSDITAQIPANFILYPDDVSFTFEPLTQVTVPDSGTSATSSAVLHKKGTMNAIIFDRTALSRAIMAEALSTTSSESIRITNLDSLQFAYATSTSGVSDRTTASTISFTLSGTPNFVWVFDENKLKTKLLGVSKTRAHDIVSTYPAVKEVWITTKPFWYGTIPSDPKKVTIVNTLTLE